MDYKYIEQLLERYWQCETSLEEEEILRAFFRQEEIPGHLLPYKHLFAYERLAKEEIKLGDDFEANLMARIERPEVEARRVPFTVRLRPLFKAAAIVAIMVSLGTAVQRSLNRQPETDYNYDAYKDTYTDPRVVYGEISDALMSISERINKYQTRQHARDSVEAFSATVCSLPVASDSIVKE